MGEYYDSKNRRYMFRKMIDGDRVTITADTLLDLRKQENELLCGWIKETDAIPGTQE